LTLYEQKHRHSFLSDSVVAEVLEADILREIRQASTIARAAHASHPDFDASDGSDRVAQNTQALYGTVPYFGKHDSKSILQTERDKAVEQYHEMVRNHEKNEAE